MENNDFTNQFKLKRPDNLKKRSLRRRLEEFEIEVIFESDEISLTAEKPLSKEEWQEILKNNLR